MVSTRGMAAALNARVQREAQRRQMVNAAMNRMAQRRSQSQDRDQRREERDEDRARYDTEQKQKQVMDAVKVQEANKRMLFDQVLAAAERARPGQGQAFAARGAEIYGPGAGEMVGGIADAASTKYEQAQADEKRKQVLHRLKVAGMMHKMRQDMAGAAGGGQTQEEKPTELEGVRLKSAKVDLIKKLEAIRESRRPKPPAPPPTPMEQAKLQEAQTKAAEAVWRFDRLKQEADAAPAGPEGSKPATGSALLNAALNMISDPDLADYLPEEAYRNAVGVLLGETGRYYDNMTPEMKARVDKAMAGLMEGR